MKYYLSLGANLGNREQTLRRASEMIEQQIGPVPRCSSFYYSEPWGFESEHAFCNLCCLLETDKSPLEVLRATQAIERALGRTKKSVSPKDGLSVKNDVNRALAAKKRSVSETVCQSQTVYSDRSIDIDIIQAFDNSGHENQCQIFNHQSSIINHQSSMSSAPLLTLPHPLWQERDFVKIPLQEITKNV